MVLDVPAEKVIEDMVQRGYTINLNTSPHMQQLVDYLWDLGYICCEIEYDPVQQMPITGQIVETFKEPGQKANRFLTYMLNQVGLYLVDLGGPRHMCAWDGSMVYDPKGYVSDIHNHRGEPLAFFIVRQM
jgi:hypothetical protein